MRSLVARVRRWWRLGGSSATVTPFEVACACGQVQRGLRQSRHQVLRCACGRDVFVLGRSPLPPPPPRGASVSGLRGPGRREGPGLRDRVTPPAAGWWRWPLLAAALTLAAVVALYAVLFGLLPPRPPATVAETAGEVRQLVRAGEAALAGGNFRLAEEKLAAARALLEQRPGEMTAHERRQVVNLHRQAALLADLLSESLGEILQHASALPEEEWQAQFARRYHGQAVVFDADVRRDAAGQHLLDYHVQAGVEPARVDLTGLRLLTALPRDRPPRLLFGARLGNVAREAPGAWVVRFDPDSGVLLTHAGAVAASCPPPIDEDMMQLLRRQETWAAEVP